MTIAGKINVVFVTAALLLGCIATVITAQRAYQVELERLVEGSLARVLSRPDLQLQIYRQDEASLKQTLGGFLEPRSVSVATALDSLGEILARQDQENTPAYSLPSFQTLKTPKPSHLKI